MVWEGLSPPHVSRHPLAPARPTLGLLGPDLMRLCVTGAVALSTLSVWNVHSRSLGNPNYPLRWGLGRKPPPPRSPSRQGCLCSSAPRPPFAWPSPGRDMLPAVVGGEPLLQDFLQVMDEVGTTARGWGALGS